MSFHCGVHYYALCDHDDGGRRCEASLVPPATRDVFAPASPLVQRGEVFNAVKAVGWQVTYLGNGQDRVLCPEHAEMPGGARTVVAVDALDGGGTA